MQDAPSYRCVGEHGEVDMDCIDIVSTRHSRDDAMAIALVNKHISEALKTLLSLDHAGKPTLHTRCGTGPDDYNDVGRDNVKPFINTEAVAQAGNTIRVTLPAYSVNTLVFEY